MKTLNSEVCLQVQCSAVQCSAVQCSAVQCSAVQCMVKVYNHCSLLWSVACLTIIIWNACTCKMMHNLCHVQCYCTCVHVLVYYSVTRFSTLISRSKAILHVHLRWEPKIWFSAIFS